MTEIKDSNVIVSNGDANDNVQRLWNWNSKKTKIAFGITIGITLGGLLFGAYWYYGIIL